jgi:hypothetical protein
MGVRTERFGAPRICATPGCMVTFLPKSEEQFHHHPLCARVHRMTVRAQGLASAAFWYVVLDAIHYFRLALPHVIQGKATIHRSNWIRLFYQEVDESGAALRAWERFKNKARSLGIAPPIDDPTYGSDAAAGFLHLDISRSYDLAFEVLGHPHPGGEEAEARALERRAEEKRRALLAQFATALQAVASSREPS